jgi:hypothetical protein
MLKRISQKYVVAVKMIGMVQDVVERGLMW